MLHENHPLGADLLPGKMRLRPILRDSAAQNAISTAKVVEGSHSIFVPDFHRALWAVRDVHVSDRVVW
tara:strand:- start:9 stop:212 length:204 start_codon:yes stop_codon:yes gene_type:complete